MSSCPGTFEGFIEDSFFADRIEPEYLPKLKAMYEPFREYIEEQIGRYLDKGDEVSWRTYRNDMWDYLPSATLPDHWLREREQRDYKLVWVDDSGQRVTMLFEDPTEAHSYLKNHSARYRRAWTLTQGSEVIESYRPPEELLELDRELLACIRQANAISLYPGPGSELVTRSTLLERLSEGQAKAHKVLFDVLQKRDAALDALGTIALILQGTMTHDKAIDRWRDSEIVEEAVAWLQDRYS